MGLEARGSELRRIGAGPRVEMWPTDVGHYRGDVMELSGQTAVVTGAGRGIGLAIARQLADLGANVALLARTAAQVDGAAVEINEMGNGRARAFPLDVRDASSV